MSLMGKDVWAVVCGALRQEFELYVSLAILCEYRSQKLIDGIVLSTWVGEIERFPGLRKKLDELHVHVVELTPLDERCSDFANLNFLRQSYQLSEGLKAVPDDVFVLKCRTDFSIEWMKKIRPILEGGIDMSVGTHGNLNFGIRYRIVVFRMIMSVPFMLLDLCFLGYKLDLRKISTFEMTVLNMKERFTPDVLFYLNIFMNDFPILREFYSAISFSCVNGKLFSWIKQSDIEVEGLPGIVNKFFALYFILLKCCFFVVAGEKIPVPSLEFSDFFKLGMQTGANEWKVNVEIIRKIVDGECEPTYGYLKLYREICNFLSDTYAKTVVFTEQDYDETQSWGERVADIGTDRWLKRRQPKKKSDDSGIDFNECVRLLFCRYTENRVKLEEFSLMLKQDIFSQANEYKATYYQPCFYYNLEESLERYRRIGGDIHEMVFVTAGRTLDFKLLKRYAKGLYSGNIAEIYVPVMEEYFEKKLIFNAFFTFPMLPDRISAYYYYGKYSEKQGNKRIISRVYQKMSEYFHLEALSTEPESYADVFLATICRIVRSSFREYRTNTAVRYMIDFLIDEFGSDRFDEETWSYIEEYAAWRKFGRPFLLGEPDAYQKLLHAANESLSECEASVLLRLLLREKWGELKETWKEADDVIGHILGRTGLVTVFTDANFCHEHAPLDYDEIKRDDDFILLCRILCERGQMEERRDELRQICGESKFRRMTLELFIYLMKKREVYFFGTKNNCELWMNHRGFIKMEKKQDFIVPKNKEGIGWPQSDVPSKSAFAAYMKHTDKGIYLSIEFCSASCASKREFLAEVNRETLNHFDAGSDIIRFRTVTYDSDEDIEISVKKAVDEFCRVAELITDRLIKGKTGMEPLEET